MFVIVGWLVCLVCVFGVFIIHGGNISVILKALPWEMLTIGGATVGAFLANNQTKVVKATMKGLGACFKGSKYTKARYMELLALLFDILQKARKEGLMAIEKDVEEPEQSEIFKKYATVGSDHHVVEFITDYLRMMVSGNLNAHEIESIMDSEIETHHHEEHAAVAAIQRVAGGLPAFGIVAAVLGIVVTMGHMDGGPEVIGHHVAAVFGDAPEFTTEVHGAFPGRDAVGDFGPDAVHALQLVLARREDGGGFTEIIKQLPHPHRADTFNHVERDKRLRGIHDAEKLREKPRRGQAGVSNLCSASSIPCVDTGANVVFVTVP